VPILHWEGRIAYRLIPNKWIKHKLDDAAAEEFRKSVG